MRVFLIAAALVSLAACGREEGAAPTAPVEPLPEPSKPPLVEPPAAPVDMTFIDASGAERLRLSCREDPAALHIVVPGFTPIGSEDRLTVGAGDEAFAHVADLDASGPGVVGGGPIDPDLMDRLGRGEAVSAVYGAQTVGPLTAARPEALAAFTERCRGLASG